MISRRHFINALAALASTLTCATARPSRVHAQARETTADIYGGDAAVTVPDSAIVAGTPGYFRLAKYRNRWLLVTPLNHAFWLKALYNGCDRWASQI